MDNLTPITREEMLMNDEPLTPITREEKILAGEDLECVTRREYFLKKYRHAGGDVMVEGLEVTANGTYTAPEGKAYSPVEVAVPLPENAYLLKEASGSLVSFSDGADLPMPSFVCNITAQQDLHGYDAPWVGGAGKNKLPNILVTNTFYGVNFTKNQDGTYTVSGTSTNDNLLDVYLTNENGNGNSSGQVMLPAGEYKLSGISGGSQSTYRLYVAIYESTPRYVGLNDGDATFILTEDTYVSVFLRIYAGVTINNLTVYPMIRLATETDPTFAPYSNICPISGHIGVEAVISPTTEASAGTTIAVSWQTEAGEVYGGYIDLVSGVLTVTRVINRLQNVDYSQNKTGFIRVMQALSTSKINDSHNSNHDISNRFTFDYNGVIGFSGNPSKPYTFYVAENKIYAVLPYGSEDTLATINTWLNNNPTYICSTLATPITYQLTPTQIKSLLGNNNAWCSTGNVNIDYFAKEV